jgi:hypothetical protein
MLVSRMILLGRRQGGVQRKLLGLIQVDDSSLEERGRDSVLVMRAGVASWADHDFAPS